MSIYEHTARQRDPSMYSDFSYEQPAGLPDGVFITFGLKDGTQEPQHISFESLRWPAGDARKWLEDNKYSSANFEAATGSQTKKDSAAETVYRQDHKENPPVYRQDRGEIKKVTRLDNGFLRIDSAYLTRTGVFTYMHADGSSHTELRLAEEVFHPDSMDSLRAATVTVEHPPEIVTSDNYQKYAVGIVDGPVSKKDDMVEGTILLTHKDGIDFVEKSGHREVSCGYMCQLEKTPGVYKDDSGEMVRCDFVQRKIKGNHLALTQKGRAGDKIRLNMDGAEQLVKPVTKEQSIMAKINLDGYEVEVSDQVASGFKKIAEQAKIKEDALEAVIADQKADSETMHAKVDVLTKDAEAATKVKEDSAQSFPAEVRERVGLEKLAEKVLGAVEKMDSMSNMDLKKAVLGKAQPELKLDSKSDEYVNAAFDLVAEQKQKETPNLDSLNGEIVNADGADDDKDSGKLACMKRDSELWRDNLEGNLENLK